MKIKIAHLAAMLIDMRQNLDSAIDSTETYKTFTYKLQLLAELFQFETTNQVLIEVQKSLDRLAALHFNQWQTLNSKLDYLKNNATTIDGELLDDVTVLIERFKDSSNIYALLRSEFERKFPESLPTNNTSRQYQT